MTIKLPEPVQNRKNFFGNDLLDLAEKENLYTEYQLKQAIKDALENAAKVCEGVADLSVAHQGVSQGSTYSNQCADDIRKLKDQL